MLFYIYIEKALAIALELIRPSGRLGQQGGSLLWFRALKSLLGTLKRLPFRMELRPTAHLLFVHVVVVVVAFAHLVIFLCSSRLGFILSALLRGFCCLLATAAAARDLVGGFRHLSPETTTIVESDVRGGSNKP